MTVSQEKDFIKKVCGGLVLLVAVTCAAVGSLILLADGPALSPVVLLVVGIVTSCLALVLLYKSGPAQHPPPALDLPPPYRSSWRKEYIRQHPHDNLDQKTRGRSSTQSGSRSKMAVRELVRHIWTIEVESDLPTSDVVSEHTTPVAQADVTLVPIHANTSSNIAALPRGLTALRVSSATRPVRTNSAPSSGGMSGPFQGQRSVTVTGPLIADDGLPSYDDVLL